MRSFGDAFAMGTVACILRMFMAKKFVMWPFAPVCLLTYFYRQNDLLFFYNKKYFDMLNVGEEFEMGIS